MIEATQVTGLEIRAGAHTGEVERRGDRELKGVPGTWHLFALKP